MKEHTKAYTAGLIDSDGSLSIAELTRSDCKTSAAKIAFYSSDKLICQWLVDTYGGKLEFVKSRENKPHYKPEYVWHTVGAQHSSWFLSQILPYLSIKHQEALMLREYYSMSGIQTTETCGLRDQLLLKCRESKNRSVETDTQEFDFKDNLINAYFAGIVDGDGCITITKRRSLNYFTYSGNLSIVNIYKPLVQATEKFYGGKARLRNAAKGNRQDTYQWQARNKKDVESILLKWLPYLRIKQKQALLLLNFARSPRIEHAGHHPNRADFRETFHGEMKKLNNS
jgi:hypothetical protein